MRLPERAAEMVEAIKKATGGKRPYHVDGNRFIGTDAYQLVSGAKTIHLLNYCNEKPVDGIRITLGTPFAGAKACRLLSPDMKPNEVPIKIPRPVRDGDEILLPKPLRTYCALVFE
jgi:hypothetical protein